MRLQVIRKDMLAVVLDFRQQIFDFFAAKIYLSHHSFGDCIIYPVAGISILVKEEVFASFFIGRYRFSVVFDYPFNGKAQLGLALRQLSETVFKGNVKLSVIVHTRLKLPEIGHKIHDCTVEVNKIVNEGRKVRNKDLIFIDRSAVGKAD